MIEALQDALHQHAIGPSKAAACQGVHESQWSRQVRGVENNHISLQRMEKLPADVLEDFALGILRRVRTVQSSRRRRGRIVGELLQAMGRAVNDLEDELGADQLDRAGHVAKAGPRG